MKIETLGRYGIPDEVIKHWHGDGVRQLLPIQIESVTKFGLLKGDSLIISGPGTSGKTFCGEMAALKQASSRRKAVFIVPLKSIAVEKFKTFQKRYAPLGLKIRMSTRDHSEYEKEITKGDFDILITIYEKLNSLTASDITIIKNVGCFILDEFQMISDPQRGAELELIVSKIRRFNPRTQLVLLIGGNCAPEKLSEWLGIRLLEENRRPVDLRLGVLFRGTFHFRGYNDHTEGDERWLETRADEEGPGLDPQALAAIKFLSEKGEQIIIFTSTKRSAVAVGEYLSVSLDLNSAKKSLKALNDIPPSLQNDLLGRCLHGGTAFHHAELDQEQRELVESGFRSGDITVLSSTTTLAWGVNLPARNVFIESMKYSGMKSAFCRDTLIPLTSVDYYQAAGRAGRIGMGEKFGRAVLTASTPFENEILWENYVYGSSEKLAAAFSENHLPEMIMKLISCGAAESSDSLTRDIGNMFSACDGNSAEIIGAKINSTIDFLKSKGLVSYDHINRIISTDLGKIVSSSGVSAESIMRISEKAESGEITEPFEWLYFAFDLKEWRESGGDYFTRRDLPYNVIERINELSPSDISSSKFIEAEKNRAVQPGSNNFLAFLFALEWISGRPMREIEKAFNRGSGGIRKFVDTLCWLLRAIEKVVLVCREEDNTLSDNQILALASRLKHGLPESKIPLTETLGINREFILRLDDFGIKQVDDLLLFDPIILREILPLGIVEKINKRINIIQRRQNYKSGGNSFKKNSDIIFTGKYRRLLKEAVVLGESVYLQPKLYSYFQKLWWASCSGKPWVNKESLEPGINQPKYISKLRKSFYEKDIKARIESDGNGSYRLLLLKSENSSVVVGDK